MAPENDVIKKIKRYYLFHGPNPYKLNERVASLIKAAIPEGGQTFDLDRFEGKRCDIPTLLNSISTPPVIGPLRIVALADVDKIPISGQKMIEGFLDRIPEYSVLAMTAAKADKRSGLFKKLISLDRKQSFEFNEFSAAEAAGLAVEFAAERGKEMSPQVADMLVAIFGVDPYRLANEVEKLALYTGRENRIEKKDLAFSAGFVKIETPYDLPDLIISGQVAAALELASRALMSGTSEIQLLYILKNHLSRLCISHNSNDLKEVIARGRMPYFAAKTVMAQSKKISQRAVLQGLAEIFRAEYSLKSARFDPEMVIAALIMRLYFAMAGNNNA
jgi:DNA polymerase-3 subunit delta